MIPKIIHYCWFGGNPIPEKDQACIASWKKYCPDYEIKRWDESNYDITKNQYMYEAYQAKKWGFVPDFARLDIIYNYGGIYLDTDVEVIKSLDSLLENEAFMGFEGNDHISPGLGFGAEKNHHGIKELLSIYDDIRFINADGTFNTLPSPVMNTEFLKQKGAVLDGTMQTVLGITVYPNEYFCPMSYTTGLISLTEKSYSIHRYNMSWVEPTYKKWHQREQYLSRKVNPKVAKRVIRFLSFPDRVYQKFKKLGFANTIKFIFRKFGREE